MKLVLGSMWAKVSDALGGDQTLEVATERAGAGVRGSSATFTALPGGKVLEHVIEGTGWIHYPGQPEIDFPAGTGRVVGPTSAVPDAAWPAAAQAAVPATDTPPALTAVSAKGLADAGGSRVLFTLDRSATVTAAILRGSKVVAHRSIAARRGRDTLRRILTRTLPHGTYTIRVTAIDSAKRTTIVTLTVRI
jgi:hypothetical protein